MLRCTIGLSIALTWIGLGPNALALENNGKGGTTHSCTVNSKQGTMVCCQYINGKQDQCHICYTSADKAGCAAGTTVSITNPPVVRPPITNIGPAQQLK